MTDARRVRPRRPVRLRRPRGRLAGLDVGTKTIGIALCDAGWTIASPAETIVRAKFSVDAALLPYVWLSGVEYRSLAITGA